MADEDKSSGKGPSTGSDRFAQLLSEIEAEGKNGKELSGTLDGPFFSRAIFGCVIRIGIGDESR